MRHRPALRGRTAVLRSAALLAVGALALTACAGSDEPAAEATSSGPPEPVEIRFSWWGSDTRHELTQQVLESVGRVQSCPGPSGMGRTSIVSPTASHTRAAISMARSWEAQSTIA